MPATVHLAEITCYIQGTSTTSLAIGTGSKTFVLAADIAFLATMTVTADAGSGNTMTGTVTSYTSATKTLVLNITSVAGSGTFASWTIGGTTTLRYSTHGFTTKPAETPANTHFEAVVSIPGNFERNMFRPGTTGGRSEVGYGALVLENRDGRLDPLLEYGFDGRQLLLRRGLDTAAYPAGFTTLLSGTLEQPEFSWGQVTFRIRDRLAEVADKPMQTVKYLGDNSLPAGVEGTTYDLIGKPKPWLFGVVSNISPPLVNTSQLIYQLSHRQIARVDYVKDRFMYLTAGTARASIAALEAGTPAAGTYDWYLGSASDGAYVKLGSVPSGSVTVDATQGAAAANRTVAQLVKKILTDLAGVAGGDIDTTSFDALDTANSAVVGVWVDVVETRVGDVLDELCQSVGGYWTVNSSGKFSAGRLEAPSGSPVETYEKYLVIEEGEAAVERLATNDPGRGLPVYRVNLGWGKNYTLMTDGELAGWITNGYIEVYKKEYRTNTATDAAVQVKHLLAPELTVNTLIVAEADAITEASRLLTLYKTRRDLLRVRLPADRVGALNLGDVVRLKLPRFGWAAGKDFRVLGMTDNLETNIKILTLWG